MSDRYYIDQRGKVVQLKFLPQGEISPACRHCMYDCFAIDDETDPIPLEADGSEVDCFRRGYFVEVINDD